MDSDSFKTFVEVVRFGSITKAAKSLCVTQSAVSRRIQHMESKYGCLLLNREANRLTPTEKGKIVLEKAFKFLEIEEDLAFNLKNFSTNKELFFLSTPTFSFAYLKKILEKFITKETQLSKLEMVQDMPESIRSRLRSGEYAFAVIEHCPEFDLSEFERVSLPDDDLVFVSKDVAFSEQTLSIDQLLKNALLSCGSGCCTNTVLKKNLAEADKSFGHFTRVIECQGLEIIIQSALAGSGIAFLPRVIVKDYLDNGQLFEFRVKDCDLSRKRSLVFASKSVKSPIVSRFAEEIVAHFQP